MGEAGRVRRPHRAQEDRPGVEARPRACRGALPHLAPRCRGARNPLDRAHFHSTRVFLPPHPRRYLDLHEPEDRKLLSKYAAGKTPRDLWTSPECRPFASLQNMNIARQRNSGRRGWRPAGENDALDLLGYLKRLHKAQRKRGGRSFHEQSAASRAPCDGGEWPWAISADYEKHTVSVAGCSVGMMDKEGEKPLAKQWRIESTSAELLVALAPYKCSGGHEHGEALGSGRLWRTASYTPFPWPPASSDEARSSSRRFAISAATKSMVEGNENLVTTKRRP